MLDWNPRITEDYAHSLLSARMNLQATASMSVAYQGWCAFVMCNCNSIAELIIWRQRQQVRGFASRIIWIAYMCAACTPQEEEIHVDTDASV